MIYIALVAGGGGASDFDKLLHCDKRELCDKRASLGSSPSNQIIAYL